MGKQMTPAHDENYKAMGADVERETEAQEWCNGLAKDMVPAELTPQRMSLADALYMPGADEIELPLPERVPYVPRKIDW